MGIENISASIKKVRKYRKVHKFKKSPILFAISYFGCMIFFAIIYNYMPYDSFYHSTSKYEKTLKKDMLSIRDELNRIYLPAFKQPVIDPNKFEKIRLICHDVNIIDNGKIIMDLDLHTTTSIGNPGISRYGHEVELRLDLMEFISRVINISNAFSDILYLNSYPSGKDSFVIGYIEVNKNFLDRLIAYKQGMMGFPSKSSGNFWRMFYLSTATITTIGYGDILPITNSARILVSVEAILGIIIIGFFINSIAKASKSQNGHNRGAI